MKSRRAIAASAADRAYGRRRGTCRALWAQGRIRGREEPSAGRHGRRLMLSIEDLDRHFLGRQVGG